MCVCGCVILYDSLLCNTIYIYILYNECVSIYRSNPPPINR